MSLYKAKTLSGAQAKRALGHPAVRAKIAAASRLSWADPERRARQSARMKKFYTRPGFKKLMVAARGKGAAKHRSHLDELATQMYRDYQSGLSLSAVGRKYHRTNSAVAGLFEARGLSLRHDSTNPNAVHLPNGCFAPAALLTEKEIQGLVDSATKLSIPDALRLEWRKWTLDRRADFIARVRAKLKSPRDRPTSPFSKGLEPFDYASPRAQAMVAKRNEGLNSRTFVAKLDVASQGVIWRDKLWFWCAHSGGYFREGQWTREEGRPSLHKTIWEEHNGRKVPSGHVIVFLDGNRNNHAPKNLRLQTKNDIARRNQAVALAKKSRELTATLLKRAQKRKDNPHEVDLISTLK